MWICKKYGHKWKLKSVIVRKPVIKWGIVAEDYYATIKYCSRCGEECPIHIGNLFESYSLIHMPTELWSEMHKHGYVIIPK
jgi:hypothetical protein